MNSKSLPHNHRLVPDLKVSPEPPASHFCFAGRGEGGKGLQVLHRVIPYVRPATVQFKKFYKYDINTSKYPQKDQKVGPIFRRFGLGKELGAQHL